MTPRKPTVEYGIIQEGNDWVVLEYGRRGTHGAPLETVRGRYPTRAAAEAREAQLLHELAVLWLHKREVP